MVTSTALQIQIPGPGFHPLPKRPLSSLSTSPPCTSLSNTPRLFPHIPASTLAQSLIQPTFDEQCLKPTYDPHNPFIHSDEATALSAVRNLKDVAVNGRNLRVESSTDEPGPRRGRGGVEIPVGSGPGGRGPGGLGGGGGRFRDDSPPPPQRAPLPMREELAPPPGRVDLHLLPPGQEVLGQKATDAISNTLAAIRPGEMQDVMAGMKVSISFNLGFVATSLRDFADADRDSARSGEAITSEQTTIGIRPVPSDVAHEYS